MRKAHVFFLLLVSVFAFASCSDDSSPTGPAFAANGWPVDRSPADYAGVGYDIGDRVPNFVASDQLGNTDVELTQFFGSIVILNFSCTWSVFCDQADGHLQATADSLNGLYGGDLKFWVLDVFDNSSGLNAAGAKAWADDHEIEFPVLFGPEVEAMARAIDVVGFPQFLFLDPNLRVHDKHAGGGTDPTQIITKARATADAYLNR